MVNASNHTRNRINRVTILFNKINENKTNPPSGREDVLKSVEEE